MVEESGVADVVVIPKFDMQCHEFKMTGKDVKNLVRKYKVPLDLHPCAPTKGWTMDKLPDDHIGPFEKGLWLRWKMGCEGDGYEILKMSKHTVHLISKVQMEVVSLVDVVLDGAFGGVGEEEVIDIRRCVERIFIYHNLGHKMIAFGGIIVSLYYPEPKGRRGFVIHGSFDFEVKENVSGEEIKKSS
ncbi:hypothetical protein Tco_0647069 [Tanacetum coccineum]